MIYRIAEKFKSVQGEGVYAGQPMAFIRFVGCSVGKSVCAACDTDFEEMVTWRGGGEFTAAELLAWSSPYEHICITGGEPLDNDLNEFITLSQDIGHRAEPKVLHLETSGTKQLGYFFEDITNPKWVCVSPKPGFIEDVVMAADEVKVIMPGLGVLKHGISIASIGRGAWPTLQDALRWAQAGKTVFIQPRNGRSDIDQTNLRLCQDIVAEHPTLRLSVQLHKVLKVQ